MKYIDNFLNKITMYRVVLYGLTFLVALSIVLGFSGVLGQGGVNIFITLLILCFACGFSNYLIGHLLRVEINVESQWITAFILTLIFSPVTSTGEALICFLVGVMAMASKYLFAINKKHIFNPVAIALVFLGVFGGSQSIWWIGNSVMLFFVAIVGFMIVRKTKRSDMVFSFLVFSVLSTTLTSVAQNFSVLESLKYAFISGPLIFFATVMLTEPLTTPPDRNNQIVYAGLVGFVYGLSFNIGPFYNTPELALVLGNIYSYIVSPKERLKLVLLEKRNLTPDTYEFSWKSDKKINFNPGQYLEWTLGQTKPDSRGNRRYFTISSSPTEENIKLGIKTYPDPSTFKQKLVSLNPGDVIFASQLAGEFTMPKDVNKKMVWIAGGIGVTPFRSMAKYIVDKQEKRDVEFFFSNKTSKDLVYMDIFSQAKSFGLKLHCVCNSKLPDDTMPDMKYGFIDETMLRAELPDYTERVFYISGPHGMVSAFESTLNKMGVPRSQIRTDFFPGFV